MPPQIIKACLKHLSGMIESGLFMVSDAHKATAVSQTLPVMHPECILEWVDSLNLQISESEFKTYAEQMVGDGDLVGAAILIAKFKFHADFDIKDIIVRLIEDVNRVDVAKSLIGDDTARQTLFVNILAGMKNVKGAVKCVKDFQLEAADFPLLVQQASFNAANYFVSQVFRAPNHPDHIPLSKVEDLFSGDTIMTGCLVTLLIKRWIKVHKGNTKEPFLQKILGIIKRAGLRSTDAEVWLELKDLLK